MPLYPPGSSTTLSDATPANVQPGVPDAGVATEASRDDHAHDASWSGVAPSASAPGDAAATGAAQGFNRRDHVHGRESYATIASNLKLDDLAAPDDNTDLNVLTTKHGLAPKLSNVSTEYLSGTGVYSVPAGGSGIPATIVDAKGDLIAATAADTVARLAVGTDTHVLTADAAEATGLKWAAAPGAGSGIAETLLDAKGDLIAATAADTAARLAVGSPNDLVLAVASGETTGLQWQARSKFKRTVLIGGGNLTTTSTSKVAIDTTNLAYLTFTLAVGDVMRCKLNGQGRISLDANYAGFDFEVDQPTSGNVFVADAAEVGVAAVWGNTATTRVPVAAEGFFTATEAGVHGFRPAWAVSGGTGTLSNATSGGDDVAISFSVEKLGPVTA